MQSSTFFDYPEQEKDESEELVLLPGWNDEDWDRFLSHTETRRFNAGDVLIQAGDTDRSLFLVSEGSLEVLVPDARGDPRQIATIDAGSIVGEQAFLDGFSRSATVRALKDGELLRLSIEAFELFAVDNPENARSVLFDLGRIISIRLRHTSALLR